jgi:hypothetical protein
MAALVSLMIVPNGTPDAMPQFLMYQSGAWRDMSPPVNNQPVSVSTVRNNIDGDLNSLMSTLLPQVSPAYTALKARFRAYANLVVPDKVQRMLAEVIAAVPAGDDPPVLRIHVHPQTEWIPFEMLHDGTDFLGLRYQISRLPIVPNGPDISNNDPHPVERIYSLLGENVLDLQQQQSWTTTFDSLLSPLAQERRYPSTNGVTSNPFPNVDQIMEAKDADILHVMCHGNMKNAQGEVFWTLNDQSPMSFNYNITSIVVQDLALSSKPLVFGNACASSVGAVAGARTGLTPSFGAAFFTQGALNFIGTFAPVTKNMALRFARYFYVLLLGSGGQPGLSIGKSLLETKKHFQGDNDPSYLFYCLYGPQDTNFKVGQ